MAGTLYLLPASLGDTPWEQYLPSHTRETACRLNRFIVENAKTARAELKRIGHPLPLREIVIDEIPGTIDPTSIDQLLYSPAARDKCGTDV
jgi:16S rRNA (cytidine1402-2'-O)-methyltransferase